MALNGRVAEAKDGARGFDTDCAVSYKVAQAFVAGGYSFCVRYLSRGAGQGENDLSAIEAADILAAGLALMAVQHVAAPGWSPSEDLGETYGINAANNAIEVGLPEGISVWCDLEGVAAGTAAEDVIDYCQAWCEVVEDAGYVPGLYVGANCILSGQQLYDLPFDHYWKSESRVPVLPARGYQMVQSAVLQPVHGLGIDEDVAKADSKGGRALWLAPVAAAG